MGNNPSNININVYDKHLTIKHEAFSVSTSVEQCHECEKFEKIKYQITYNSSSHKYDLNLLKKGDQNPFFTYKNPGNTKYRVGEVYSFFLKSHNKRPVIVGFKTIGNEYFYYRYTDLVYIKSGDTIDVDGIDYIYQDELIKNLNFEGDIVTKESTIKTPVKSGYGCVYLSLTPDSKNEYVVDVGSNVICSVTVSRELFSDCRNIERVIYKFVYFGDLYYNVWHNTWYQWSNKYYYVYIYSGRDSNNEGTLLYSYYPRSHKYTVREVSLYYSVVYPHDPFYITFTTRDGSILYSTFDEIKRKQSGYNYDFVSTNQDYQIPALVKQAYYNKYKKLTFIAGKYKNQNITTSPANDKVNDRLTFGNKKYKRVLSGPDPSDYTVIIYNLSNYCLFTLNASESLCSNQQVETDKLDDPKHLKNKPINSSTLTGIAEHNYYGAVVYYTNDITRLSVDSSGSKPTKTPSGIPLKFTVQENVALLVELIVDCNTKKQLVRKDADGNQWEIRTVDYKNVSELVKELDSIKTSLIQPAHTRTSEEEFNLVEYGGPSRPGKESVLPPDKSKEGSLPVPKEKAVRTQSPTKTTTGKPPETKGKPTSEQDTRHKTVPPQEKKVEKTLPPPQPSQPLQPSRPSHTSQTSKTTKHPQPPSRPQPGRPSQQGPHKPLDSRQESTHRKPPDVKHEKSKEKPPGPPPDPKTHHQPAPRPDTARYPDPIKRFEGPPEVDTGLKYTILIMLDKQQDYDKNHIDETLDYSFVDIQNYNIMNKKIKVVEKTNTPGGKCKSTHGFKVFEQDLTETIGTHKNNKNIEIKFLIPFSHSYDELRLYSSQNSFNEISLYYIKDQSKIYVYFYKSDPKPFLFCYTTNSYAPASAFEYNQNWYSSIKNVKCDCEIDSNHQLLTTLFEILGILYEVQLTQTFLITSSDDEKPNTVGNKPIAYQPTYGVDNIEINVTYENKSCYRMYLHKLKSNLSDRLGRISHNRSTLEYNLKQKLQSVAVYYNVYDITLSFPLMVVLGFESYKDYYKLVDRGHTTRWKKLEYRGDNTDDSDFLSKLRQLEQKIQQQRNHEDEKELQKAIEDKLYEIKYGLGISEDDYTRVLFDPKDCSEGATNVKLIAGSTVGTVGGVGAVGTGVVLAKFPELVIPSIKALL